jgi:hypothetical protein
MSRAGELCRTVLFDPVSAFFRYSEAAAFCGQYKEKAMASVPGVYCYGGVEDKIAPWIGSRINRKIPTRQDPAGNFHQDRPENMFA